jgi:hypothetical protein
MKIIAKIILLLLVSFNGGTRDTSCISAKAKNVKTVTVKKKTIPVKKQTAVSNNWIEVTRFKI